MCTNHSPGRNHVTNGYTDRRSGTRWYICSSIVDVHTIVCRCTDPVTYIMLICSIVDRVLNRRCALVIVCKELDRILDIPIFTHLYLQCPIVDVMFVRRCGCTFVDVTARSYWRVLFCYKKGIKRTLLLLFHICLFC